MALKKTAVVAFIPGTASVPGTPGYPGSPSVPGHWVDVTTPARPSINVLANAGLSWVALENGSGYWQTNYRLLTVPTVLASTVRTWVPAVLARPAIPAVPGQPETAARTVTDMRLGWNAGAVSKGVQTGNFKLSLSAAPSSIGIVAGLNSANIGVGYVDIDHGFYFTQGKALVYEGGVAKTAAFGFAASDVFDIKRMGGVVTYLRNDVLLYTSGTLSIGPVFADASLYAAGDTITAASFTALAGNVSSNGQLAPLGGLAADRALSTSSASLQPLDGLAKMFSGSAGALQPLGGFGANQSLATSAGQLAPLGTLVGVGDLVPTSAIASGSFSPMMGVSRVLTGQVATVAASLSGLHGLAANRNYGTAQGRLLALQGFGSELTLPAASNAYLSLPALTLVARGHDSAGENSFAGVLPKMTLGSYGGANAKLALPSLALAASATSTNWGNAALNLPALTLEASGTVSSMANAEMVIRDAFRLTGYSGAVCAVSIGGFAVEASGTTGAVGAARLTLPMFALTASGAAQNYGGADLLLLPALQAGATAQAWLVLPGFTLSAIGTAVVAATYEAYSINLTHPASNQAPVDEVTRYTNFPFTHVVRYQGSYFGAAADGLYLLEGTTDDGAAIPYAVKTCIDDFKTPELKTVASAFLAGRLGPDATVSLHAGEQGTETYAFNTLRGQTARNHREKFGRGVKNRYFALELAGTDALELDSIELEINKLTRRT